MTELFDTLAPEDRESLRWMIECGLTPEAAAQLLDEGLNEEASTGSEAVTGLPGRFTQSARNDLKWFDTGEVRERLDRILGGLRAAIRESRCQSLPGANGWLLRDGPFRVVFRTGKVEADDVVFAIAPAGFSPITKVWRYFDQFKAEDLLKTGCLYFCRLDQLTGDPREGRLPLLSKQIRAGHLQEMFGERTPEMIEHGEEIFRGTTYVCCWTRREHESYLAWRHYCSDEGGRPGGGFAIQTTWRQIEHLHSVLRAADNRIFCDAVGYIDPLADDPSSGLEGEAVFWKSRWFLDETEIRYAALRILTGPVEEIRKHIKESMPFGEWIACDLNLLIREIVVNPFASTDQRRRLKELLKRFHPHLAVRVRESEILTPSDGK